MYQNFYNGEPYPEEVIRIDRSLLGGNEGYVYEQYYETPYKQDLTRLHAQGLLVKRQHLEVEAHKSFQSLKSIQMFSNLFMYKALQECNAVSRMLKGDNLSSEGTAPLPKIPFGEVRLSEVLEMI